VFEDQFDKRVAVDEAEIRFASAELDRLRGEVSKGDHQPIFRGSNLTVERADIWVSNLALGALYLDFDDGWFESELVSMSDNVDSAVRPFRRDPRPIPHRLEEVGHECGKRVALRLLGQLLDDEVTGVLFYVSANLGDGRIIDRCNGASGDLTLSQSAKLVGVILHWKRLRAEPIS
jgi:hypothetical protein